MTSHIAAPATSDECHTVATLVAAGYAAHKIKNVFLARRGYDTRNFVRPEPPLADKRVRGVTLDIESAGGEIINPQIDLYALGAMLAPKQKAAPKKAPPAYLKHDPTKRHKRRR